MRSGDSQGAPFADKCRRLALEHLEAPRPPRRSRSMMRMVRHDGGMPRGLGHSGGLPVAVGLMALLVAGCSGDQHPNAPTTGLFPHAYSETAFMDSGSTLFEATAVNAGSKSYTFDVTLPESQAFALVANCTSGKISVDLGATVSCQDGLAGLQGFCGGGQFHIKVSVDTDQTRRWGVAVYRTPPCGQWLPLRGSTVTAVVPRGGSRVGVATRRTDIRRRGFCEHSPRATPVALARAYGVVGCLTGRRVAPLASRLQRRRPILRQRQPSGGKPG